MLIRISTSKPDRDLISVELFVRPRLLHPVRGAICVLKMCFYRYYMPTA